MTDKLLTSDWHLTEEPINNYRWHVFDETIAAVTERNIKHVYLLGDVWDRKERFSAAFVNRCINALQDLSAVANVKILRGNHDKALKGPSFWEFLNTTLDGVEYITSPTPQGDLLLLPFSPDPMVEWQGLRYADFKAAFIHATVTGAISETGITLEGTKLPILPRSLKVYSGDVHTPQIVRNITYVGAPHTTRFGDTYPCRMLVLDGDYAIKEEIKLISPAKLVAGISSIEQLQKLKVRPGDQVRIVFDMQADQIEGWGAAEAAIATWAKQHGVTIDGTEVVIATGPQLASASAELAPAQVFVDFCASETIEGELRDIGLALLKEVLA